MQGRAAKVRRSTIGGTAPTDSMAYYGIPSAGIALTAGSDNDQIGVMGVGSTALTAQTIFGGEGNDIINFGAAGFTATLTAIYTNSGAAGANTGLGGGLTAIVADPNGVFTTGAVASSKAATTGAAAVASGTIVLTSVAAIGTIDSAFIQANAGNDTIALGTSLTRVTASEIRAGQGNDFIGFGTQLRAAGAFATSTQNNAEFSDSTIVGGKGNDTIRLVGANTFTATEIKAGAGNDHVNLQSGNYLSARIGLGDGNDILSGQMEEIDAASVEGGAGNDTIFLNNIESAVVGGDALSAHAASTDGNDSIVLNGTMSASTIYGGGGNDTLQISAADIVDSANFINLGAGQDTINLSAASITIQSATIGMGADNDLFTIADDDVDIMSATIKLGGGNDTIKFTTGSTQDITTTGFANTTIFGGAGADLLLESADITNAGLIEATFGFNTADSTIGGYDTIAIGGGSVTGSYLINVSQGSLAVLTAHTASNFTATNSLITFTSTFSQDLTARVEALDASLTDGQAAMFTETNNNLAYLFVQGGTTDTVVQIGTAQITNFAASASLTISGTNSALIHLNT